MVWVSRIFFSFVFCLLLPASALAATMTSTVRGSIELIGSSDPVVRKHRDFSGVVVWLEPLGAPATPIVSKSARMAQKNKTFVPHVLAIPVGASVSFPNFDPIFHNAFSN